MIPELEHHAVQYTRSRTLSEFSVGKIRCKLSSAVGQGIWNSVCSRLLKFIFILLFSKSLLNNSAILLLCILVEPDRYQGDRNTESS